MSGRIACAVLYFGAETLFFERSQVDQYPVAVALAFVALAAFVANAFVALAAFVALVLLP